MRIVPLLILIATLPLSAQTTPGTASDAEVQPPSASAPAANPPAESPSSPADTVDEPSAAGAQTDAPLPEAPHPVESPNQTPADIGARSSQQQPKRILGLMPNYRAVSAGAVPPPPGPGQAFKIATLNSFDYSSYAFTILTSLMAKGTDTHPDLGKGVGGLWAYTWRGFLDKTDGNYMVIWALPSLLHEDERYFAMGHGSKWKRLGYSFSQVAVARNYDHKPVVNFSELIGRGAAQEVSRTYYPPGDDSVSDLAEKYAYALMRDGLTNAFREFWPDIATHVLHRHP